MGELKKLLRVKHSGRLGDIVYSVMVANAYAKNNNYQLVMCLWDNPSLKNLEDPGHIYPGGVNIKAYEFIASWLTNQGIMIEHYDGQNVDFDFDRVKELGQSICLPFSDIRKWYQFAFSEMCGALYFNQLKRDLNDSADYPIVVNRTKRWQNPHIDYTILNRVKHKIYFIGTEEEYDEFLLSVPSAIRIVVHTMEEVRYLFLRTGFFIGNQSLFYAMAEFHQIPRALEVCPMAPNVVSQGVFHHDFVLNEGFEKIVELIEREVLS